MHHNYQLETALILAYSLNDGDKFEYAEFEVSCTNNHTGPFFFFFKFNFINPIPINNLPIPTYDVGLVFPCLYVCIILANFVKVSARRLVCQAWCVAYSTEKANIFRKDQSHSKIREVPTEYISSRRTNQD